MPYIVRYQPVRTNPRMINTGRTIISMLNNFFACKTLKWRVMRLVRKRSIALRIGHGLFLTYCTKGSASASGIPPDKF